MTLEEQMNKFYSKLSPEEIVKFDIYAKKESIKMNIEKHFDETASFCHYTFENHFFVKACVHKITTAFDKNTSKAELEAANTKTNAFLDKSNDEITTIRLSFTEKGYYEKLFSKEQVEMFTNISIGCSELMNSKNKAFDFIDNCNSIGLANIFNQIYCNKEKSLTPLTEEGMESISMTKKYKVSNYKSEIFKEAVNESIEIFTDSNLEIGTIKQLDSSSSALNMLKELENSRIDISDQLKKCMTFNKSNKSGLSTWLYSLLLISQPYKGDRLLTKEEWVDHNLSIGGDDSSNAWATYKQRKVSLICDLNKVFET